MSLRAIEVGESVSRFCVVGAPSWPDHGRDPEELLPLCDIAMYCAKNQTSAAPSSSSHPKLTHRAKAARSEMRVIVHVRLVQESMK